MLGTPTKEEWPEGMTLAAKLNFKWNRCVKTDLHKLIPNANNDSIALIESMLSWEPKKRPTASQVRNNKSKIFLISYIIIIKQNHVQA